MRRALPLIACILALSACKRELTPTEQAAADAKAIAQVEAANRSFAPPVALDPQPITAADLQRAGLLDAGCAFEATGQTDPVLVARPKRAVMKFGRNLTSFASDPGSPALPLDTWTHYVGKAGSLRIEAARGEGDPTGQNRLEWPGKLTVTDEHDRIVYTSPGKLRCGA